MQTHTDHLYGELRRMAGSIMRRERRGHTLQPTALANEAWLAVGSPSSKWDNTVHFFGAAARAMRQILIQSARKRRAQKRGGEALRVEFEGVQVPAPEVSPQDDVDSALTALGRHDAALLRLVEMRFFTGRTLEEIAAATGRSLASVKRDWSYARTWMLNYMSR